jgi:hypothetical protein
MLSLITVITVAFFATTQSTSSPSTVGYTYCIVNDQQRIWRNCMLLLTLQISSITVLLELRGLQDRVAMMPMHGIVSRLIEILVHTLFLFPITMPFRYIQLIVVQV